LPLRLPCQLSPRLSTVSGYHFVLPYRQLSLEIVRAEYETHYLPYLLFAFIGFLHAPTAAELVDLELLRRACLSTDAIHIVGDDSMLDPKKRLCRA
jgi:hypothetical protein